MKHKNECDNKSLRRVEHIRVARAKGVISNPGGSIVSSFSWGLDISTNNQAKAYALLQGLKITINIRIWTLIVVGDSKNVIKHMVLNTIPCDTLLSSMIERIKKATNYSPICNFIMCCGKITPQRTNLPIKQH
jgi:hypothetical protein